MSLWGVRGDCLGMDAVYCEHLRRILRFLLDLTASFYFPFGIAF